MPWSSPIAVCFWLKEKKHQTEQHPPVTTGSPCLSAQESLATHRGCPCPVVLMEQSLPSWPDRVTFLLAVDRGGCGLGRSYLSWRALTPFPAEFSRGERPGVCRGFIPSLSVCPAVTEEAINRAATRLPALEAISSSLHEALPASHQGRPTLGLTCPVECWHLLLLSSQGERGQDCAVVWSHRCVFLAEREEAPNGAASPCDHGQPLPLCPRVCSVSPRLSVSRRPDGAVTSILSRACHCPVCCENVVGVGWGDLTSPGERWQLFLPAEWSRAVRPGVCRGLVPSLCVSG